MSEKTLSTRQSWTEPETRCVLDIWQDYLPKLRAARRKAKCFDIMAKELQKRRVIRTGAQIKTKIDNLTKKYREIKQTLKTGSSPPRWQYYSSVHKILGRLPANNPDLIDESLEEPMDVEKVPKTTDNPSHYNAHDVMVDNNGNEFLIEESNLDSNIPSFLSQDIQIHEFPKDLVDEGVSSSALSEAGPSQTQEVEPQSDKSSMASKNKKRGPKKSRSNSFQEMIAIQKDLFSKFEESRRDENEFSKQQLSLQERSLELQQRMVAAMEKMFTKTSTEP